MAIPTKRTYKDTVFRLLFSDAKNALSLYNALGGTDYKDSSQLEFNTLENAIYMNIKNDISFLISDTLNLYEHQSTINSNIPLRNLFYVSDLLQKYVKVNSEKSIYGEPLIPLPNPKFMVFYNGTEDFPEQKIFKLSDSYIRDDIKSDLELSVLVINVNPGFNEDLKKKCPILRDYITYVECIRENRKHMDLPDAVEKAVNDCINNNVLREFLLSQKSEVSKMSIYEYDEEEELRKIRAGEREIGQQIGEARGILIGEKRGQLTNLINQVCKKLQKGKLNEQIADELEEDLENINRIVEAAKQFAPEYDVMEIYNYLQK